MKWLKRLGILAAALVLIGAVQLARYDARDWIPVFLADKNNLTDAPVNEAVPNGKVTIYDMEFGNDRGLRVHAKVSVPDGQGPYPAVVLVTGVETGSKVFESLPPQPKLVVVALDWPGSPRLEFGGLVPAWQSLWNLRSSCLKMVPGIMLAGEWLEHQRLVNKDHITLIGVSAGALVAPAAAATDTRFTKVVLVQGGCGLGSILAANAERLRVPFSADMTVKMTDWLFRPVEPRRYINRISPRQVSLMTAKDDPFIPQHLAEELFSRAAEPKRQLWIEAGHVDPAKSKIVTDLSQRILAELSGAAPVEVPVKKIDPLGR